MTDTAVFSIFRRPTPPDAPPAGPAAPALAVDKQPSAITAPVVAADLTVQQDIETPASGAPTEDHAQADQPRQGAWLVPGIAVAIDQLGLAHPDVIALQARLRSALPTSLEASTAGIYRPVGFRPAPWSGFAYDQAESASTGLATGTRILIARGEVEVEQLLPGDAAMVLRGPALLPITWIGRTAAPSAPVLIEAGALGSGIPRRRLCVGPDQTIFLKPEPVAAHTLVNGTTIRLAETETAELFQIDVGRSEIILAEGLAVSSSHGASERG